VLELERRARRAGLLGEAQRIPRTKKFRTAKTDLDIESIRTGFGRGGEWAWKLGAPNTPAPKAHGHLCEEPSSPVTKSEPEPVIIHGDANPRAELGSKLSRVAGANTGLRPAFVEIGGIPRKWSEGGREAAGSSSSARSGPSSVATIRAGLSQLHALGRQLGRPRHKPWMGSVFPFWMQPSTSCAGSRLCRAPMGPPRRTDPEALPRLGRIPSSR
jgi:hypothetical protein